MGVRESPVNHIWIVVAIRAGDDVILYESLPRLKSRIMHNLYCVAIK